jgi:histidinol-phosphate aminotransferase
MCARTRTVVLDAPNYVAYERYAQAIGLEPILVRYSRHPEQRVAALSAAVPDRAATLVVANPHAFTGELLEAAALEGIAAICHDRDQLLVVDEAYAAFADVDHSSLLDRFDNVVVLRSFSKSCGMAGLRAGVILASPRIIRYLRTFGGEYCVSSAALQFIAVCVENRPLLAEIRRDIARLRDDVAESVRSAWPRWWIPRSSANFLLMDPGQAQARDQMVDRLLSAGILVRSLGHVADFPSALRMTVAGESNTRRAATIICDTARMESNA